MQFVNLPGITSPFVCWSNCNTHSKMFSNLKYCMCHGLFNNCMLQLTKPQWYHATILQLPPTPSPSIWHNLSPMGYCNKYWISLSPLPLVSGIPYPQWVLQQILHLLPTPSPMVWHSLFGVLQKYWSSLPPLLLQFGILFWWVLQTFWCFLSLLPLGFGIPFLLLPCSRLQCVENFPKNWVNSSRGTWFSPIDLTLPEDAHNVGGNLLPLKDPINGLLNESPSKIWRKSYVHSVSNTVKWRQIDIRASEAV